jgi:hypothetical protein
MRIAEKAGAPARADQTIHRPRSWLTRHMTNAASAPLGATLSAPSVGYTSAGALAA